jgi:hypothetical protein
VITFDLQQVPGHTVAEVEQRLLAVDANVPRFFKRIGMATVATAKRHAVANATNYVLKRRTGALVGWTQQQRPVVGQGFVEWGLPSGDKRSHYGKVLDDGMENIHAKVGQYLRIPLSGGGATTNAGVDRYAGISLRTVEGFFVAKSKAGNLIVFRKADRGAKAEPWYVLKRTVTIPPKRWFTSAFYAAVSVVPVMIESRLHELETAQLTEAEAV